MLVQSESISTTSLNSGTAFSIDVDQKILRYLDQNFYYNTRQIRVKNATGATFEYLPLTQKEYEAYVLDPTVSDLIPIATGEVHEIVTITGTIAKTIIKGSTGHSGSASLVFTKRGGV